MQTSENPSGEHPLLGSPEDSFVAARPTPLRPPAPLPAWRRSGPSGRRKIDYHTGETWRPSSEATSTNVVMRLRPLDGRTLTLHRAKPVAITPRSNAIFGDRFGAYAVARSKRTSCAPSHSKARNLSLRCCVLREPHQHADVVAQHLHKASLCCPLSRLTTV